MELRERSRCVIWLVSGCYGLKNVSKVEWNVTVKFQLRETHEVVFRKKKKTKMVTRKRKFYRMFEL